MENSRALRDAAQERGELGGEKNAVSLREQGGPGVLVRAKSSSRSWSRASPTPIDSVKVSGTPWIPAAQTDICNYASYGVSYAYGPPPLFNFDDVFSNHAQTTPRTQTSSSRT